MPRGLTSRNLLDKRTGATVQLHGESMQAIGAAERKGCWIIYGVEKNGKTWLALMLAKVMAAFEKVSYVSAEEGTDLSFRDTCRRAGITSGDRIIWYEYMSVDEIIEKHKSPRTPNIIFIDNLTIYADEMKPSELKKKLVDALPNKLFILLAHEERKDAYPALARMAKKIAKVIIHVKGLKAFVVSRFGEGGELNIDEEKSTMFWGENTNK